MNSKEVWSKVGTEWEIGLYDKGHMCGFFCRALSQAANRTDYKLGNSLQKHSKLTSQHT